MRKLTITLALLVALCVPVVSGEIPGHGKSEPTPTPPPLPIISTTQVGTTDTPDTTSTLNDVLLGVYLMLLGA